jgi:hypothetical protein
MSSEALKILSTHILVSNRAGHTACLAPDCDWEERFTRGQVGDMYFMGRVSAEHQLELLEGIGFNQQPCTRTHSMPAPRDDSGW